MTDNLRAAAFLMLSMLLFAVEDALIKILTRELPYAEVLGMIALAGVLVFGGLMRLKRERFWTPALRAPAVVLRNVTETVGSVGIVLSLALTELSTTLAIMQAVPLFITLGAAIFLREPVGWRRASAIVIGFIGVLIVLRPGLAGFEPASLWALVAAMGFAARDLVTRRIPPGMSSRHLSAAAFLALLIAAVPMALLLGQEPVMPDGGQTLLAVGCGVITVVAYTLLVTATRIGEASVLAPVRYSRLLFALVLAVIVFGERLDAATLIGSAIIVGSGCYTFWREARLARRAPTAAAGAVEPPLPASATTPAGIRPDASGAGKL